jgi:hypothetical protein
LSPLILPFVCNREMKLHVLYLAYSFDNSCKCLSLVMVNCIEYYVNFTITQCYTGLRKDNGKRIYQQNLMFKHNLCKIVGSHQHIHISISNKYMYHEWVSERDRQDNRVKFWEILSQILNHLMNHIHFPNLRCMCI